MRQAGFLAAAGIFALDHNIERLKEDHQRAREIGKTLENLHYVKHLMPIDTNIIIFTLEDGISTKHFLEKLTDMDVLALPFGPTEIRMITHLDFTDDMLDKTITALTSIEIS